MQFIALHFTPICCIMVCMNSRSLAQKLINEGWLTIEEIAFKAAPCSSSTVRNWLAEAPHVRNKYALRIGAVVKAKAQEVYGAQKAVG